MAMVLKQGDWLDREGIVSTMILHREKRSFRMLSMENKFVSIIYIWRSCDCDIYAVYAPHM